MSSEFLVEGWDIQLLVSDVNRILKKIGVDKKHYLILDNDKLEFVNYEGDKESFVFQDKPDAVGDILYGMLNIAKLLERKIK